MLTELRLQNFKRFGPNAKPFPLAPLTVILGANASGKSTIFQSLLALGQGFHKLSDIGAYHTQGESVDLGLFSHVLHRHAGATMRLEVQWSGGWRAGLEFGGPLQSAAATGPLVKVEHSWPTGDTMVLRASPPPDDQEGVWLSMSSRPSDAFLRREDPEDWVATLTRVEERTATRATSDGETVYPFGVHLVGDELQAFSTTDALLEDEVEPETIQPLQEEIEARMGQVLMSHLVRLRDQVSNLHWIGPSRRVDKRVHTQGSDSTRYVGSHGQHLASLLEAPGVSKRVNELLQEMGVPYTVAVTPRTLGGTRVLTLELLDRSADGVTVTLADVGYGVSQLLPILTQLAVESSASDPGVIMIEEPEIHLHPAWQARLATVLLRAVQPREDGRRLQIMVETHSETFVLRLQRMIRSRVYPKEDIALLSVSRSTSDGTTIVEPIRLDDQGDFLDPWPDGFFAERFEEQFEPWTGP